MSAGWFQQCGGWFDNACGRGVTDDRYSKRFWGYLKETGFHERLTTKEDIQFVDVLLREFIAELETKC